jgi:translation initiation factor 1
MPDDLVYSTMQGRMCPVCGRPQAQCAGHRKSSVAPGDGIARVGRETKGRKGKCVTVVSGISLNSNDLDALAKELKQKCGAGGTVKDGVLEIQGDHREVVARELQKRGFKVKFVGG